MVAGSSAASYFIHNATLLTLQPLAERSSASAHIREADLGIIEQGCMVVAGGKIAAVGTLAACKNDLHRLRLDQANLADYDAAGNVVMPGFIDAHTHALFAGNRLPDFEDLSAGRSPALGMHYTIEQTRRCPDDELAQIGIHNLRLMLAHGTTTAEVKSGYDLTEPGENRLLDVLKQMDARDDLPHVIPTFCGAHALPPEFASYDRFVDELCTRFVPAIAAKGVARFADAFCEQGFFSPQQSEKFLSACAAHGLKLRIHANELHHSGGAGVAAKLRTASADHLNFITADDIAALASAGCSAVLCPGTVEYLGLERCAPARDLIAADIPVAVATDFNPGTCPSFSLQMMAYFARRHLRLTAAEAIAAITINAAHSLAVARETASLSPGKRADIVVLAVRDYRELGYYFGSNIVTKIMLGHR